MTTEVSRLESEIITLKLLLLASIGAEDYHECEVICANMSRAFKLLRLETEASTEGVKI